MFAAAAFISLFSLINYYFWGDAGYIVHMAGAAFNSYWLVWLWIALIAFIFLARPAVDGTNHKIGTVISTWWLANIGSITLLNYVAFRGIEEAGPSIFGLEGILLDFTVLGFVDLTTLIIIWALVKNSVLKVSIWTLVFCGYMVANLFGHTSGAYNLMIGVDADTTAQMYDSYMYLAFTVMLGIQAGGAALDALLRLAGSHVNIYADLRSVMHRANFRDLHFH